MPIQYTRINSAEKQLNDLNRMLKDIIDYLNSGGSVAVENSRPSEITRAGGTPPSEGAPRGDARFRAVPQDPTGGGVLKLQFHDGFEWKNVTLT